MRRDSGFDFILEVWNRRKWLALVIFAASFSAALSVAMFLPNLYQSAATVIVERQQVPDTFVKPAVTSELETRLHTISQQILSRARLLDLIMHLDLYRRLRARVAPETVVEQMRRDIKIELKEVEQKFGRGATIAFTLSYRGRDPQKVASVANTLASFYVEENRRMRGRQASETAGFLKGQLEEMRSRLDDQARRVSEIKRRSGAESPLQMHAHLLALERLSAQLRLNSERLTRAAERRESLAKQLTEATAPGTMDGAGAKGDRIGRLKEELAELRTRFTDKYPDVMRIKAEIAALERRGLENPDTGSSTASEVDPAVERLRPALGEVEEEIERLRNEEKRLQQAMASYQQKIERAPLWQEESSEMLRDYETTKELYSSLLKRYIDAQQAEDLEERQKGEQFRILDPAVAPRQPDAPKRIRLILMGLMLSFGMGVGALLVTEQLDTSFHSVDDLRAFTKVPVLVSIPRLVTGVDFSRQRRQFWLAAGASTIVLALIVGASYYMAHENEQLVQMLARGRF